MTASGTIQADEIRLASGLGGRILTVEVAPGEPVQAGTILVHLDDTTLQAQLLQAEAAVVVAQAKLAELLAGARVEEIAAAEANLTLAQAGRDGHKAAWDNALSALDNPQVLDAQIAEARTKVQLAEQGVALATAQLAQQELIRDQKRAGTTERDIAEWQVTAAKDKLATAEADLESAQVLLNGLWGIRSRPLALIAQSHLAEGQYQIAEAGVVVARAQWADLIAGATAEEIAVAKRAVQLEQAKVDAIRTQQDHFCLDSPIDGVVLDQFLRAGELAAPAATILTLADLNALNLTVYVPVYGVGRVQIGQEVQIAVDSFPGQVFTGYVARIGDRAEYTPRNVATPEERLNTFYAVEIRLDNPQGLLKPGMPADARFVE